LAHHVNQAVDVSFHAVVRELSTIESSPRIASNRCAARLNSIRKNPSAAGMRDRNG
jgi:hypothetical protein